MSFLWNAAKAYVDMLANSNERYNTNKSVADAMSIIPTRASSINEKYSALYFSSLSIYEMDPMVTRIPTKMKIMYRNRENESTLIFRSEKYTSTGEDHRSRPIALVKESPAMSATKNKATINPTSVK